MASLLFSTRFTSVRALRRTKLTTTSLNLSHRRLFGDTHIERGDSYPTLVFKNGLPPDFVREYNDTEKPIYEKLFQTTYLQFGLYDKILAGSDIRRVQAETNATGSLSVVGFKNEISAKLYDVLENRPTTAVVLTNCVSGVGRTSIQGGQQLRTLETGELLINLDVKLVPLHKETLQPTPLPEWFTRKYSAVASGDSGFVLTELPENQTISFTYTRSVSHSDLCGKYMFMLAYYKYCTDCATVAFQSKAMKKFSIKEHHKIKALSVRYMALGKLGDELAVDIAEEESSLSFTMRNLTRDVPMFYCNVQFY